MTERFEGRWADVIGGWWPLLTIMLLLRPKTICVLLLAAKRCKRLVNAYRVLRKRLQNYTIGTSLTATCAGCSLRSSERTGGRGAYEGITKVRKSDVEVGPADTDMDENWMLMTSGSEVKSIEVHCEPLSRRLRRTAGRLSRSEWIGSKQYYRTASIANLFECDTGGRKTVPEKQ